MPRNPLSLNPLVSLVQLDFIGPLVLASLVSLGGLLGCNEDDDDVAPTETPESKPLCPETPAAVDPTARRADAPPFAVHGPFAVGYRKLEVAAADGARKLEVKAWYPAQNADGKAEAITYDITLKNAEWAEAGPATGLGHALAEAPVDASQGPYPLVVFSHGYSLTPEWYGALVEHYASHGFVVLAPEHLESDWFEAWAATFDRPLDVKRTLDFAESLTAPGGALEGLIDLAQVAVVGHSYGGYTALAMGGAQLELGPFAARCAALTPEDPKAFLCAPFLGKEAEMAARAGLAAPPTGLWPSLGDARVKAIVPMAGDAYLFDATGLASIQVPLLALGGTDDFGTPWEWGAQLAYDHAGSPHKALVGLVGANHMIFANPCEALPFMARVPELHRQMMCFEPIWDHRRGLDLIRHFSTAFLRDVLADDAEARAALAVEAAAFPGIEYTMTR